MTSTKQKITFGKFQNVDLRVAVVEHVEEGRGTRAPTRVLDLDVGELGKLRSVGQFAFVEESELLGAKIIVCVNLGEREMGPYVSQALVLGTPHPESPADQSQAVPLWADRRAMPGDEVY